LLLKLHTFGKTIIILLSFMDARASFDRFVGNITTTFQYSMCESRSKMV